MDNEQDRETKAALWDGLLKQTKGQNHAIFKALREYGVELYRKAELYDKLQAMSENLEIQVDE
jgi:hypothetical protein